MGSNISVAIPAAIFVIGVFAMWAAWGLIWQGRTRVLARRFPGSETINGIRSKVLDSTSAAYVSRGEWVEGPGAFPMTFTVVIDRTGISFWRTRNSQIVSIAWADLGPVTFVKISQSPRSFRGINFQVLSDGARIDLPVIAIGRGPFGQFVQSKSAIEAVCLRAESWRLTSRVGRA
jgi:hypothetical protein